MANEGDNSGRSFRSGRDFAHGLGKVRGPCAGRSGISCAADASDPRDVTVAIFAAPTSYNSPPYWHVRDYGLFSVNPFGRKAFDPKADLRVTRLGVGEQIHLRFQMAVYAGQVGKDRLNRSYAAFAR